MGPGGVRKDRLLALGVGDAHWSLTMSQAHRDTKKRKQPGQRLGGGRAAWVKRAAGCGQRGGQRGQGEPESAGVLSPG